MRTITLCRVLRIITAVVITGFLATAAALATTDVPKMTKDELKGLLGNPEVIIMDVRTGKTWKDSTKKIQGAVREEPENFESWADKYPKSITLVLY